MTEFVKNLEFDNLGQLNWKTLKLKKKEKNKTWNFEQKSL